MLSNLLDVEQGGSEWCTYNSRHAAVCKLRRPVLALLILGELQHHAKIESNMKTGENGS